jgi:4-amino-4-deoxy-L-arabinose transferase-like glycosyltransferase
MASERVRADPVPRARTAFSWWQQPRIAVPLLVGLALVLRLPNLGECFWFDEIAYATHVRNRDAARLTAFLMRAPGPPLYAWLSYWWVALAGQHEVVVRLPSLLCGVGSVALTWAIARRYTGDGAALLAGLLMCLSPTHIWYSQEAAPYSVMMFFSLAAVLIGPRVGAPSCSWASVLGYVACLVTAALTHYYAAALMLPLMLFGIGAWRGFLRLLAAHALVAAVLGVWLVVRQMAGAFPVPPGFLRPFTLFEWWMLYFQWFLHGNTLWTVAPAAAQPAHLLGHPLLLVLQGASAALLVRGLWPGRDGETRARSLELALSVGTLPLVLHALTLVGFDQMYIERYVILSLPFFFIILARGAARLGRLAARQGAAAGLILIAVASYTAFRQKESAWTVFKPNPDWRAAIEYMRHTYDRPRELLIVGASPPPLDDFVYYLEKDWPEGGRRFRRYGQQPADRLLSGRQIAAVVLVYNRFWPGRADRAFDDLSLVHGLRLAETRSFTGVNLHAFTVIGSARLARDRP